MSGILGRSATVTVQAPAVGSSGPWETVAEAKTPVNGYARPRVAVAASQNYPGGRMPHRRLPGHGVLADALNLPNLVTMGRIGMIPFVLLLILEGTRVGNFWAAILYSLAAVTDAVDGWLARRRGMTSILGQFLDPLADKLLVLAVLLVLVQLGRVPAWMTIIIVARELSVTTLRIIAMSEGVVIGALRGGKDKAALQMVAVLTLILHHTYDLDFFAFRVSANLNGVGLAMLLLSVVFAVTSAGEYLRLLSRAVEAKQRRLADKG
ncbi:MAG: CDP-diacylglycerol--glycerol-3-phosphate 3-phosphatidyltransferase [Proteobacteria bacterium]|nr:CDP-diacylglycerol--glycerol-3-phosphate 3-phosphatidyltransferase [Pseudomonadota bacterium]